MISFERHRLLTLYGYTAPPDPIDHRVLCPFLARQSIELPFKYDHLVPYIGDGRVEIPHYRLQRGQSGGVTPESMTCPYVVCDECASVLADITRLIAFVDERITISATAKASDRA